MKKLKIINRINLLMIFLNLLWLIMVVFTKLITKLIGLKIIIALSLIGTLVLLITLYRRNKINIRIKKRKDNIMFYLDLADKIEKEFSKNIIKKEVLNNELGEYKYFFKSDYIEFTLFYDDFFIAYLDKYSRLNHYHFSSWEYNNKNVDLIIMEIREILDDDYLFGDIIHKNGKVDSTFYISLKEMKPEISDDLDSILDDLFDKPVPRKNEYLINLYGSKKFGETEVLWKSKD